MRLVRWLAWSVGLLFLVGTVIQLVDVSNLYTKPPDIPESLNMVEHRLAVQDYRVAVWPLFLLSNLATGIGFMAVTALGLALAGLVASNSSRRVGIAAGLGMAGIFGAVAQLLIIGVTQPTIDNAYCDCGFKETEIVSQIWGQQLAESASRWLTNAALVLAAVGVVATATAFRDRMPSVMEHLLVAHRCRDGRGGGDPLSADQPRPRLVVSRCRRGRDCADLGILAGGVAPGRGRTGNRERLAGNQCHPGGPRDFIGLAALQTDRESGEESPGAPPARPDAWRYCSRRWAPPPTPRSDARCPRTPPPSAT